MKKTNQLAQKKVKTQYIVQYKQRLAPDEWWGVTLNSRTGKRMWTREEAEYEIARLKREDEAARRRGHTTTVCGGMGISCQHYREYDIIAYRIRKREVTPWETDGDEETVE